MTVGWLGIVMAMVLALPPTPYDLVGRWEGALAVGDRSVNVVIRVEPKADTLNAELDSPDQNAFGIPISDLTEDSGAVRFLVPLAHAGFEGVLSPDGNTLTGSWNQAGATLPLILVRTSNNAGSDPALDARIGGTFLRPQTPSPPFPYRAESVAFDNASAGVRLAGTLNLPTGAGPFPAAILITGSGPQDRDETLFGHKPFLVLADALVRQGIAVLRYDDRGIGSSTGDFASATSQDFATDAEAALGFLVGRGDIDRHRIGLIGHSEGGTIALRVANADQPVAWVVMIAGPAVPGGDLLTEQIRRIARVSGASSELAESNAAAQHALMAAVAANANDGVAVEAAVRPLLEQRGMDSSTAATIAQALASPWYRWFVAHDPAPDLLSMTAPLLALYGDRDVQVPADINAAALRRLSPGAKIIVFPELNHLMQPAHTGLPDEYQSIETTFAPEAIAAIATWVVAQ